MCARSRARVCQCVPTCMCVCVSVCTCVRMPVCVIDVTVCACVSERACVCVCERLYTVCFQCSQCRLHEYSTTDPLGSYSSFICVVIVGSISTGLKYYDGVEERGE